MTKTYKIHSSITEDEKMANAEKALERCIALVETHPHIYSKQEQKDILDGLQYTLSRFFD